MLAVAPSAAGALLVVTLPARDADHALYCAAPRRPTAPVRRGPARLEQESGGVRAAHAATALGRTLILVEPTPRAVLLGPRDRVVQALKPYRASGADPLGLALPDLPLGLAFAVRTEEEQQLFATARGIILPTPVT